MAERIIITGSSGYIGSQLARAVEGELYLVDKKEGIDITDDFYKKYKSIKPSLIYHLAAQTDIQSSLENPEQFIKDNILGTMEIAKFDCPIIFASTAGVYGDTDKPSKEDDKLNPENVYSLTKMIGEDIIKNKKRFVILRFGNVFGGIGGKGVFEKLKKGKINGDGTQTRDFIHIDDVVAALLKAREWENGIYNISSGEETSINRVADALGTKKIYSPAIKEQKRSCLNISKALKAGWKPILCLR